MVPAELNNEINTTAIVASIIAYSVIVCPRGLASGLTICRQALFSWLIDSPPRVAVFFGVVPVSVGHLRPLLTDMVPDGRQATRVRVARPPSSPAIGCRYP